MRKIYLILIAILFAFPVFSQLHQQTAPAFKINGTNLDYFNPKEYIIGGTTLNGTQYLDKDVIITLSKLIKGEKIILPGDATANAIKNLWDQGLFNDVKLSVAKIDFDTVYFALDVVELPRLSSIEIKGVSRIQKKEILEKLNDKNGKTIINDNLYNNTTRVITKYLADKGFYFATVAYNTKPDANQSNGMILEITVNKGNKIKAHSIDFEGNNIFSDAKLRKYLSKPKQQAFYKIFGSGKFNKDKYEESKPKLIAKLQEKGYRDATLIKDSLYKFNDKSIGLKLKIYEGTKYYFGNITWVGNAKYSTSYLEKVLGIEKGDIFSEERLEKKIRGSQNGDDVSSVYLNDGYLTFNIDPVQTKIRKDTIDIEMRITEGPQYVNNRILIKGNTTTHDRVILRAIRTKPGEKFSKELLMRTVREIGQLGNFNEQKTSPKPIPNPADGTVDLEYTVEEKASDQIELSGGFGGGRVIATVGVTFNNFSLRNVFHKEAYRPLPKGDGQKLSLRVQTNGQYYQSYSLSFLEPWLGGKKPVNFGFNAFTSLQTNGYSSSNSAYSKIRINGITVSLGKVLKWPDNYFSINYSVNAQQYLLHNYPGFLFNTGSSYNFNLTQDILRDSRDSPIFPTGGSYFKLSISATPPYSALNNKNYAIASDQDKYRFTEYHKWKFDSQWFQRVVGKLVFKAQAQFGFLGTYNQTLGESAFERFKLGGDGMQGFNVLQGSEVITMRGYSNNSVIPVGSNPNIAQTSGSPIYTKYVLELRYPVIASQQATAFITTFAEGGNTWNKFSEYNPFNVRRSIGVGARIFLPIFGMLGLDYGYGFDSIPGLPNANKGQFHFSIAQQLGSLN